MRKPRGGSGTGHGRFPESELLKLQKSGQFPDESVRIKGTNSLCNLPEVLGIGDINDTTLGGLLFIMNR